MSLRERVLRNTFFSSVAMYTEFVLGMVVSILIARHLGPEVFGVYSTVIWIVAISVAATNSGTASAAIRFVAELRGAGQETAVRPLVGWLRRAQRRFMAVVLVVCALALWRIGTDVAPEFDHSWLFGFLVLAVALRASYMFNIGVAKGLEDFRINATVALIAAPLNLALVCTCMLLDLQVEWLLGAFLLSSVAFAGISWMQLHRLLPPGDDRPALPAALAPRVRRQMLYSAVIVSIGFVVGSEVEVMFLTALADSHDAGQFKVGYQLATSRP
jgi:O-antigen/teichoic acid export membrane protein